MKSPKNYPCCCLGDLRAENDIKMLSTTFLETSDYHAIVNSIDFNFIVGRRGSGKSALFIKATEFFNKKNKEYRVFTLTPDEPSNVYLIKLLSQLTNNYHSARYIMSVVWKVAIMIEIANDLCKYYKLNRCTEKQYLLEYRNERKVLFDVNCMARIIEIIKTLSKQQSDPSCIPYQAVSYYDLDNLESAIRSSLSDINRKVIVLIDKLDEGWMPQQIPAAVIGGLANAIARVSESNNMVHIYVFMRDNIFRVLSHFDNNFSRDIESTTIRLHWDQESLLSFVANRIRILLEITQENDIKIWNRFAKNELAERSGFSHCLHYTLFRPRDLLVLLNTSLMIASKQKRTAIITEDVENAAIRISSTRLQDLYKEYDQVLPGIELLISYFKNQEAYYTYDKILLFLDGIIINEKYTLQQASDFAILNSGREAFLALYRIGFVGVESDIAQQYIFSFDGSSATIENISPDKSICIHPCYWAALNLQNSELADNSSIEIFDDYTAIKSPEIAESRRKQIGQLISELPAMQLGTDGASQFENWSLRSTKILFAGNLANFELKPNGNSVQRRDIVATNIAKEGFWKRILDDYKSRQIVFEIKNITDLELDHYRQALSYSKKQYGMFIAFITRNDKEGLRNTERKWLLELYNQHDVLIFTIPAQALARCISKLRSKHRFDYADNYLNKCLDKYERNYLSLKS